MDGSIASLDASDPERMRASGYKEVRHWVVDLDAPGMRRQIGEAVNRINASEEEADLLAEIEENTADVWRAIPE